MLKVRYIGLDVHKDTITIAVADGSSPAYVLAQIANDAGDLLKRLRKLRADGQLSVCYEGVWSALRRNVSAILVDLI